MYIDIPKTTVMYLDYAIGSVPPGMFCRADCPCLSFERDC